MKIAVDIWGGEMHLDHVARFLCTFKEAMKISERELKAGFLVNMREEAVWGPEDSFDSRIIQ